MVQYVLTLDLIPRTKNQKLKLKKRNYDTASNKINTHCIAPIFEHCCGHFTYINNKCIRYLLSPFNR